MRLSPTSLMLFEKDPREWFIKYRCRAGGIGQTPPMAIGSVFDACVKAYLMWNLPRVVGDKKREETLTKEQVDADLENRAQIIEDGREAFRIYREIGALSRLVEELRDHDCQFEFNCKGLVECDLGSVELTGRPDCVASGAILDWKVNGFYSKASPKPGYIRVFCNPENCSKRIMRNHGSHHKDCFPMEYGGWTINGASELGTISEDWGLQTTVYSWLRGGVVGEPFVACIDQLVGPRVARVAQFRCKISTNFQLAAFRRFQALKTCIDEDHYFKELSITESQTEQKALLETFGPDNNTDDWFKKVTR